MQIKLRINKGIRHITFRKLNFLKTLQVRMLCRRKTAGLGFYFYTEMKYIKVRRYEKLQMKMRELFERGLLVLNFRQIYKA